MADYAYLAILFPLLGVLLNGVFGWRFSKRTIALVGCGSVYLSFLVSLALFSHMTTLSDSARSVERALFQWIPVGDFKVDVALLLDSLSVVMMLVVTGVGFLIHVYSVGYMDHDPGFGRFFTYLNLFVVAMLTLVMANNFLLMYVGWEGVGLCSYLLIGFWYQRHSAVEAAKKAFFVNRIGDFGFALGVMLIFKTFSTLNFAEVFSKANDGLLLAAGSATAVWIALLLFIGATGKSAQIPLYVWLPDAMEGPTPVSALIHAATMVTAGVYMVARCHVLYELAPAVMLLVAIIGTATAFLAATIALVQTDIKRVLAYSTISQLGFMFLACGVGAFAAGIFHLMTHAFFKALLFLGAGSVIHALSGEQDMNKMGGLFRHLRVTAITFWIGALAISGVPLLSGFFSKDEILTAAYHGNKLLWVVATVTALMTAFYMFRQVFKTFHGECRVEEEALAHLHESPKVMTVPLVLLAVGAIAAGWVGTPWLNGFGNFLAPVFVSHSATHEAHHVGATEYALMALSLLVFVGGLCLARRCFLLSPELPRSWAARAPRLYDFLKNKWYMDEAYNATVVRFGYWLSGVLSTLFDVTIIDGAVNGLARFFVASSEKLRKTQSSYVRNYALSMALGAALIIAYYLGAHGPR